MPIVSPSMAHPTLTEPTYVRPPFWKPVLAWIGLVLGGLIAVTAIATLGSDGLMSAAMALLGLAAALPGGWWLYCEHKDRVRAEEDFQLDRQAALAGQAMAGYVSPDALGPLTWDTPLTPFRRRWSSVGSAAAALFVGFVALIAAAGPAPVPAVEPTSGGSAATGTVTSTARAAAPTTTVTQTATTSESTVPAAAVADSEAARESAAREQVARESASRERAAATQQPTQPAYTPEPRSTSVPAPAPVAEAAPQSAYYPNCSAARAAGAAPLYRGQPGYAAKLDRDNDGVACE
ncbi:excalibur calcium-binding domain-containing protein [Dietzia cinnamea]|uniref:excalibur calcium-binding domain-containing protein n=1 Tax=Dietzia cinnamea TaxID=321318 RepID=UPI0021A73C57|nr:excalibur calcium-binding domain-containing protein [Dietzia cinnamea]MCT1640916.1 excalibur calcium-binding domain-containing protein [Dietzia cinnamea]